MAFFSLSVYNQQVATSRFSWYCVRIFPSHAHVERKVEQTMCYLRYYCTIRYDEYDWKSKREKFKNFVLFMLVAPCSIHRSCVMGVAVIRGIGFL